MGSEKAALSAADYILFTLMLLVSASIGLYFRFSGGRQKTMNEFFLAGKNMPILPVACSIMATFLSAITVVGTPADVYLYGIHMLYSFLIYPLGMVFASYAFLPVFFNLGACTAFEYLEKRFGKLTRTFVSVMFIIQTILYMAVVLYAPALALSAATSLSTWTSVFSIGIVCTLYCTLGGMKAVIWTDLFQALLMLIGIFTVLIKGFSDLGFREVFRIGYEGDRIAMPRFSLSLTERYTALNLLLKGFIIPLMSFGSNQIMIQRLLTLKNVSRCRNSLYLGFSLNLLFHALSFVVGLVIYAHFYKCDPLTAPNRPITAADQLLPYYMMTALGSFPGLPGLCICGIFSATLSTVSSAMNSLSAVTMQDLLRPLLESRKYSPNTMTLIAKTLTLFYGILCILMTVLAASFGNLIQACVIVYGLVGVPVLVVFVLGMLTAGTDEKGVLIGLLSSVSFTAWASFGAAAKRVRQKTLPISTEGCPANSSLADALSSSIFNATVTSLIPEKSGFLTTPAVPNINSEAPYVFPLYRISFMWYMPFCLFIGLFFGYFSSIIISRITGKYPDVKEEYLSPFYIRLFGKKNCSKEKEMEIKEISRQEESEYLTNRPTTNDSSVYCVNK